MADDDMIFDPSKKKKKKTKTVPFDIEAVLQEGTGGPDGSTGNAADAAQALDADDKDDQDKENKEKDDDLGMDLDDFSGLKKKKKKIKKKPFNLDELDNALPETGAPEKEDLDGIGENDEVKADMMDDDDLDFNLPSRKKRKKKALKITELGSEGATDRDRDDDDGDEGIDDEQIQETGSLWFGSDRDYTYDELLTRVFDIMREKNPDMVAGEKRRFVMRPPQVVRVGTKKTSFANFTEICRMLHRQPKHLLAFLLTELGTSGSVDGNNQLIIKGRFQQKQIENVLRRYIKEYVTCHTCRSPDTILQKDTRLFFLQCESCGSRCSVVSIKSGFQAVTGKRAAIRAKNA